MRSIYQHFLSLFLRYLESICGKSQTVRLFYQQMGGFFRSQKIHIGFFFEGLAFFRHLAK
ncbi:MAG: hypothetical protein CMH56_02405 [Myxococcales bacterium]|nr:hypothetical protein [Myxococcales bacterium]